MYIIHMKKSICKSGLDIKGFTLIELLVVVLIIGILAAVALPQYQKAVERSKAARVLALLKAVGQSFDVYYMANGAYTNSLDDLAVDIPWNGREKFCIVSACGEARSNGEWSLQLQASTTGSIVVHVVRISGKYAGAGFSMAWSASYGQEERFRTISCSEYINTTSYNYVFDPSLPPGAYCEKIMRGTLVGSGQWDRSYKLP